MNIEIQNKKTFVCILIVEFLVLFLLNLFAGTTITIRQFMGVASVVCVTIVVACVLYLIVRFIFRQNFSIWLFINILVGELLIKDIWYVFYNHIFWPILSKHNF